MAQTVLFHGVGRDRFCGQDIRLGTGLGGRSCGLGSLFLGCVSGCIVCMAGSFLGELCDKGKNSREVTSLFGSGASNSALRFISAE